MKGNKIRGFGVYGIKIGGDIIYIGMTLQCFERRWNSHLRTKTRLREIENKINKTPEYKESLLVSKKLYEEIEQHEDVEFVVLYKGDVDHDTPGSIMEKEEYYIKLHKPMFNYGGIESSYFKNSHIIMNKDAIRIYEQSNYCWETCVKKANEFD